MPSALTHDQPERAGRSGESQPLPIPASGPPIHDLVAADMLARKELGIRRYEQPLSAFNGRSALRDLYEELLDAAAYIRQLIEEDETDTDVAIVRLMAQVSEQKQRADALHAAAEHLRAERDAARAAAGIEDA